MQEELPIIAGLDIGSTKVCCVVGRLNEYDRLEVLGIASAPCEGVSKGMVFNIEKTTEAIEQAVQKAADLSDINVRVVNVGLAGVYIRSCHQLGSHTRQNPEEEISVEDVRRLTADMYRTVVPHGNKIIHVIPKDYTVDYETGIKDPVGMTGARLEANFHIVYSHENAIQSITKAVKKAGLEIDKMVLAPLASSLSILTQEEKEAGVAVVDIGGGTTDIAVFYDGLLRHTAVIPFGGNVITADIRHGLGVLQVQAEQLKTRFGFALAEEANPTHVVAIPGLKGRLPKEISVRNLAHIIEARMQEIVELVHSEILASGFEDRLAAGIVITGGGALMQKADALFEFMTGQNCRIGYPNEYLAKTRFEQTKSPINATGLGLVLTSLTSLDDREARYRKLETKREQRKEAAANRPTMEEGKQRAGLFSGLLSRTKTFLADDLDDRNTGF
jgi:cell division protein FtsA